MYLLLILSIPLPYHSHTPQHNHIEYTCWLELIVVFRPTDVHIYFDHLAYSLQATTYLRRHIISNLAAFLAQ